MKGRFLRWTVAADASGSRLSKEIFSRLEGRYSLKAIKRALDGNACSVNNHKERFANYILKSGDNVEFDCGLFDRNVPSSYDTALLLYEDDDFIIYNKPAGLVYDHKGLLAILQKKFVNVIPVHRLDKDTSGAIIYAKSEEVKQRFVDLFKEKSVHKKYLAIVDGVPKKPKGVMNEPLGRLRDLNGQGVWGKLSIPKGGKPAQTVWEVLRKSSSCSLLVCEPITGRTHQIRLHLSLAGHPIIGDYLYGKNFVCRYPAKRHMLHAWKLSFPHPTKGIMMAVTAPLPLDFVEAEAALFKVGE